ncbi:hypothetical protein KP509_37G007900 [Ceratopteris richardii]|uniref:CASP-like protein n=1 Tax=Ceratopteris richardii TaxID=49495 RepID=A0A8T2Q672_CERRI|nr:hypothetical protein KP509_37G007900 [Ceratopteris richardii]
MQGGRWDEGNFQDRQRLRAIPNPLHHDHEISSVDALSAQNRHQQRDQPQTQQEGPVSFKLKAALVIGGIFQFLVVVALVVAIVLIVTTSQTVNGAMIVYSDYMPFTYAFITAIVAVVYLICDMGSSVFRLAVEQWPATKEILLWITFIGEQVIIYVLVTSASACAAALTLFDKFEKCDEYDKFCTQLKVAIAVLFVGAVMLVVPVLVSTYCFYTRRM